MGDLKGYFGFPILLLVAMWGLMETILKVTDRLNEIRNTICTPSGEDGAVAFSLANHMLWADWVPLLVLLCGAVFFLGLSFALLPVIFVRGHADALGNARAWSTAITKPILLGVGYLQLICYGIAVLSATIVVTHVVCGVRDFSFIQQTLENRVDRYGVVEPDGM